MREKIAGWLGLKRDSAYVTDEFDFENMRTSLYMSSVIIILEIWMIFSAVHGVVTGTRDRTPYWIVSHIGLYLLLIIVAFIVLIHSIRSLRAKKNRHRLSLGLFAGFSLTCILFGVYISYHDYAVGEQLFTFVSLTVFGLCLIVWRPIISLIISGCSFYLMYLLMAYVDGASYATRVNFFVMWLCIFMCSIGNYSVRIAHARRSEHLSQAIEQLQKSLYMDELTGLKNRNSMNDDLAELPGRDIIVAMADVDNFKYINDTYNHTVGDEVLRRIAQVMKEIFLPLCCRSEDRWLEIYRYGGDGFLLFASGYPMEEIRSRITDLQDRMHREVISGTDIRTSLSCGICEGRPGGVIDVLDMIRYSDHTLYEAKRLGRKQTLVDTLASMRKKEEDGKLGKRMLSPHETDPLTGLTNMHYFRSHADKLLVASMLSGEIPEFLYFDINNFKEFNETYGFQMGDRLLKCLAENMEELFDRSLVSRISDDHFIVLTGDAPETSYGKITRLREILKVEQRDVKLQLKVGVYRPKNDEADASLACDRARIACDSIRDQYDKLLYIYDEELETRLHRSHYIVTHIDEAVEKGHIKVFYQPIVRLSDGKLTALEALARWEDPVYGFLSPAAFIGVLEEHHLIHKLDLCMAELICRNLNIAKEMGLRLVPISLNLSRLDFEVCDIVREMQDILTRYDIPVELLDIEITESALNDQSEKLVAAMHEFKDAGFRLWLDDFGSGYSSLNSLKDFPFDVLKIDMKFLTGFEENARTKPILESVVHMADQIHMMALTEGVETDAQREFLRSIGCERAQGYFFGKPMNRDDITEFILSGKLTVADDNDLWGGE